MVLPWLLTADLLIMALGLPVRLPRPAFLKKWSARTRLRLCRIPVRRGALALGMATPLLPCGPLYLMAGIALVSGSAVRGAEFMLAFALGTLPLLWLAQANYGRLRARWTPRTLARVQTSVALLAFVVMAWRLRGTLGFGGPGLDSLLCHWSQ
jgi:hypothetical protein